MHSAARLLCLFILCSLWAVGSLPGIGDDSAWAQKTSIQSKTKKTAPLKSASKQSSVRSKPVLSYKYYSKTKGIPQSANDKYASLSRDHLAIAAPQKASIKTISISSKSDGTPFLSQTPSLDANFLERRAARTSNGDFVFFTVNPALQDLAENLVNNNSASHVALVAVEPQTGRILALAQKSDSISDLSVHAGFPAASLFKVITTSAAIDSGRMSPDTIVKFRGGTYELSQWNYQPNLRTDKRSMPVGEALGKSCNPVFGRVALNYLDKPLLNQYAQLFGFGRQLPYEVRLPVSQIEIPSGSFEFSRTAAGFGDVNISPIHASVIMAGLANGGTALQPRLIEKIISPEGVTKYASHAKAWTQLLPAESAETILKLMENTTTIGTSRKEFMYNKKPVLGKVRVAGKTGTLKGDNPQGLNNWFIGAPIENPKIAVAAIVVDTGRISTKASHMGRMLIQKSLDIL